MKKLAGLLVALMFVPAFAMAQAPERPMRDLRPEVRANASTTPGFLPKLGPAVSGLASSTRGLGSSTVELVRGRVEAIKQLIMQKRDAMKQRADAAKEKAKERFGEKVEVYVGNISTRLASTSAHLSSIADRLDTRIDELETQGFDMSGSIALLADARADLGLANDKIIAVNEALETAMSTTTPRTYLDEVRTAVKEAQDALAVVKKGLHETLRSIKAESSASTTVSQ